MRTETAVLRYQRCEGVARHAQRAPGTVDHICSSGQIAEAADISAAELLSSALPLQNGHRVRTSRRSGPAAKYLICNEGYAGINDSGGLSLRGRLPLMGSLHRSKWLEQNTLPAMKVKSELTILRGYRCGEGA